MDKAEGAVDESPQALYQHCERTYRAMLNEASGKLMFDEEANQERIYVVWEGMLTQFITGKLNLSVPYYTYITRALKRMGCVRQLKRGGGTSPSQWELIKEPTLELFESSHAPRKKREDKDALYNQRFTDLEGRLKKLEQALQNIIDEEANNG